MPSDYDRWSTLSQEVGDLAGILALVDWDQETMMPSSGLEARARQRSWLAQQHHKASTGPKMTRALGRCIQMESGTLLLDATERQRLNLEEARREHLRQQKVPARWVKALSTLTPFALEAWARARQERNFGVFAPWLEKIVELNKQRADYLGFSEHPYDALLDLFEPGLTLSSLGDLFDQMQPELVSLRERALKMPSPEGPEAWAGSDAEQLSLCRHITQQLGLQADRARLDLSHHPFCTSIAPGDERMTTRLTAPAPWSAIMSTLHEAGHGLYDQGLPADEWGLPGGSYCSLGVHESQSRLWECRVGHSFPFLEWLVAEAQRMLPHLQVEPYALYRWLNRVRKDLIRVEADEVSYTLHIILRTRIEAELMSGELSVPNLPARWNELSHQLLGVRPAHDAEGCLQDVHWAHGEMGYFPSYALGNIYGAQLFEAFLRTHPGWEADCRTGRFSSLTEWLECHVWRFGRLLPPAVLIERATGKAPHPRAFITSLERRLQTLGID
jgi:carboxypeptidase Taq